MRPVVLPNKILPVFKEIIGAVSEELQYSLMLLISINYFRRREYRAISYDAKPDACTTNILMT